MQKKRLITKIVRQNILRYFINEFSKLVFVKKYKERIISSELVWQFANKPLKRSEVKSFPNEDSLASKCLNNKIKLRIEKIKTRVKIILELKLFSLSTNADIKTGIKKYEKKAR